MTVINTNIKSLVSQNALQRNARELQTAMQQLSTGSRINSAADDAAGLAISSRMTSQIQGLDQAVRNANDGISLLQTAEAATTEINNMLQRMRELAVQAANDTYSVADRSALQLESTALIAEISRISNNTQWNGMYIFNTSASGAIGDGSGNIFFQVGVNGTSGDTISTAFRALDSTALSISAISFADRSAAQSALTTLDNAISTVDSFRATLGATINRLTYATDNLAGVSLNTSASRSRILDTDYAKAASEMSRTQIIQQAATAVLAQANVDQQAVLKLLQS